MYVYIYIYIYIYIYRRRLRRRTAAPYLCWRKVLHSSALEVYPLCQATWSETLTVFGDFGSFWSFGSLRKFLKLLKVSWATWGTRETWETWERLHSFGLAFQFNFRKQSWSKKHPQLIPEGPKSIQNRSQRGARRALGRSWGPISKKWGTRSVRKTTFCLILSDL